MQGQNRKFILLSFDVEEFDIPLNHNVSLGTDEQWEIGHQGLLNIQKLFDLHKNISGTFFTTANFAQIFPESIRNISLKNEIASHTVSNSIYQKGDLIKSKRILEEIVLKNVNGLRMPQMREVDMAELKLARYIYDASINPTWLPGHYNNLHKPRSAFLENGIFRIPASVSPHIRIPLFWLSFKNFPYWYFKKLALSTLKKDGYLSLYFHPWEFTDLSLYKIPWYIKRHSKRDLLDKLNYFIQDFKKDSDFITMYDYTSKMTTYRSAAEHI